MNTRIAKVSYLATGSEITSGEIINTNSGHIARILFEYSILSGDHLVVDDDPANLENGFHYLVGRFQVVITTGGLGPTADDRTREVIADWAEKKLIFNQDSWQRITDRFNHYGIAISSSNRQQAFFPEGATVLPNANGSADGFYLRHNNQIIIALPGPPTECLPIIKQDIVPLLSNEANLVHPGKLYRWRLMGVPEATIAQTLNEQIALPYDVEISYRANSPFIDVKIYLDIAQEQAKNIINAVEAIVKPYLISHELSRPSEQLQRYLKQENATTLTICDQATRGLLAAKFANSTARTKIDFSDQACIKITGLEAFWSSEPSTRTKLTLQLPKHEHSTEIAIRGDRTIDYAIEWLSFHLLSHLQQADNPK